MTTTNLVPIWGNHILAILPTSNYDGFETPAVGYVDVGDYRRSIVKCTLTGIEATDTISEATMTYYVQNGASAANSSTWSLYRIKRAITQTGSCWNTYDGTNSWGTAGATHADDIDTTALASGAVSATPATDSAIVMTFDANGLTELAKMCNGGSYTNNGFLIKNTESGVNFVVYYNYNYATAGLRMVLSVTHAAAATTDHNNLLLMGVG